MSELKSYNHNMSMMLAKYLPALVLAPATGLLIFVAVTYHTSKGMMNASGANEFSLADVKTGVAAKKWADEQAVRVQKVWDIAASMTPEEAALVDNEKLYSLFPETYNCDKNFFRRIGSAGDGGKWSCGEFFKPQEDSCVAISLGSNGQFDFEESILAHTENKCTIYTFDCTGVWTPPHENIKFFPWCLGKDEVVDNRIYKSWGRITNDLGLTNVDFFKIDIEGFEWVAMPSVLENFHLKVMPKQISIEMHMWKQPDGVPELYQSPNTANGLDFIHPAINFFRAFYKAGYHLASAEYNYRSGDSHCCQEFTFVRTE
ncbi:methyltransferase domain-containing protein [Obelidium mucronatum]|nr:methyltransferase domain-containing protein [Obelidium mucronatum]